MGEKHRTIIRNQPQLEQLVVEYIGHYNTHRPFNQQPPHSADEPIKALHQ